MNKKDNIKENLKKKILDEMLEAKENYNAEDSHSEEQAHFYLGKKTAYENILGMLDKV